MTHSKSAQGRQLLSFLCLLIWELRVPVQVIFPNHYRPVDIRMQR
jgi:hypothetical protein